MHVTARLGNPDKAGNFILIFILFNSIQVISRPVGSHDVHEFTLSKDEFKRKEANRETIYSGFIKNRTVRGSYEITTHPVISFSFNTSMAFDWNRLACSGMRYLRLIVVLNRT